MEPAEDDSRLIEASLDDPAVFGGIYDRHARELLGYLVRRVGLADAEVLLSEVFCIAFEARHRFDLSRSDAKPWLYGIASNLVMKHFRRLGRQLRAVDRLAARERHESPSFDDRAAERLDDTALLAEVIPAVRQLPPRDREVLFLYAWQDLSYAEIAEAVQIPVGTVRSRLNRVRIGLRELAEARGKQPDNPSQRAEGGPR